MTRNEHEMKNAAYATLTEQGYLPTSKTDRMAVVSVVIDAVEPLIRADERELITDVLMRATEEGMVQALREWKADFRAKVEALPDAHHYGTQQGGHVQRSDVLSLIDGEQ